MEIGSDIGTSWFGDIEPRLRHGGLRLAGLTLASDLFVLERLADRSHRRRFMPVVTIGEAPARNIGSLELCALGKAACRDPEREGWIGRVALGEAIAAEKLQVDAPKRVTSQLSLPPL